MLRPWTNPCQAGKDLLSGERRQKNSLAGSGAFASRCGRSQLRRGSFCLPASDFFGSVVVAGHAVFFAAALGIHTA